MENMKRDMKEIMVRAWEFFKKLDKDFSTCLKFSWALAKKEVALKEEWDRMDGVVTFKLWNNYGKVRAYFTCDWRSKYSNTKKNNFVELGEVA